MKAFTRIIVGTVACAIIFCSFSTLTCRAQATDFSIVRRVLGGGFGTVSRNYPPNVLPGAARILGTYRFRIINLDWGMLQGIGPGNTLKIHWTDRLESNLSLCKQYGWVPRLVWGLALPTPLMTKINPAEGRRYGPSDWALFDKYTTTMFDHVVNEGFKTFEVEVGNEPDGPGGAKLDAWWAPSLRGVAPRIWSESLQPYMVLYRHTAEAVAQYRRNHPGLVIRVGGPASNGTSYSKFWMGRPGYFDWVGAFVDAAVVQNLPLDFVSWHQYYEGPGNAKQFFDGVADVRTRLARGGRANTPISISEWGFITTGRTLPENRGPGAGVFALDFIQAMDQARVDDAIFLMLAPPVLNAPAQALFFPGPNPGQWIPSHAMIAQAELAELVPHQRLRCGPQGSGFRCFAAETAPGTVDLMVWKTLWFATPSTANMPSTSTVRVEGVSRTGKYTIGSSKINGRELPALRSQLSAEAATNGELLVSGLTLSANQYAQIKLSAGSSGN